MSNFLTHSRLGSYKTCRMKHWFEYEQGLRPREDAKALRMGAIWHLALEELANSKSLEDACQVVYSFYAAPPELPPTLEWQYEEQTILRLLCGYQWRWQEQLTFHHAEMAFKLPIVNPSTGFKTPTFEWAGKIDGIVDLEDGRMAVLEHKLLGEDIGPDANLWRRLQIESQVTGYILAARRLGFNTETVLYDAVRKPTIMPTEVPILDEDGKKIVLNRDGERVKNKDGKTWRQTGSADDAYFLQTRPMTPEEWGEKLANDIASRPEFYFQRREIARLDQDVERFAVELWDQQLDVRSSQLSGRWYRNAGRQTCDSCGVFALCTSNWREGDPVPDRFVKLDFPHPELKELYVSTNPTETSPAAASETTGTRNSEEYYTDGLFDFQRGYV